ncbi:MAG: hypothetical protein QXS20_09325 [Candidatus Thorarchaeota archaeon]
MRGVTDQYVELCGAVGSLTRQLTGTSIIDAYFGPEHLLHCAYHDAPDPQSLVFKLAELGDRIRADVDSPLRREFLSGEVRSLETLVRWLTSDELSYLQAVRAIFNIDAGPFTERHIAQLVEQAERSLIWVRGEGLDDKFRRLTERELLRGGALMHFVKRIVRRRTETAACLFRQNIYPLMGCSVTDNGIDYEFVSSKPWRAYCLYMGNYRSVNQFNLDQPFSRLGLVSVIYHEYEHHVASIWREKAFRESGLIELSILPLQTGFSVISEGTADSARDFLGLPSCNDHVCSYHAVSRLRRAVLINAAIMLNNDGYSEREVASYISERIMVDSQSALKSLGSISARGPDGRPNFWAPYIFTYAYGREKFVYPTFVRAKKSGSLGQFFRTLYANPFSRSTATWRMAFDWLYH